MSRKPFLENAFSLLKLCSLVRLGSPNLRIKSQLYIPFLLIWSTFLFVYGIDQGTLYRTEALRAMIGKEALQGNWLIPTLYGEPFLTKPPGMYVAIGLASLPSSKVTEFTARLPSILAATISVFLFYWTLKRYVTSCEAFLASLLLPISFLWLDKAPSAEIDMLQVMWVLGAITCFLRASEAEEMDRSSLIWWVLALLCVTGGFLTKWTAPAFFYLTIIPFLYSQGQLRSLFSWRHLVSVLLAISIVGWWAFSVASQTGWEMLIDTIKREAIQRIAPPNKSKSVPILQVFTFPLVVLASNLPWSLFALFTLRKSFRMRLNPSERKLCLLFHCWTWPNLFFWSMMSQQNVRYVFPLCPGIMGLAILYLLYWFREPILNSRTVRWWTLPKLALISLFIWVMVKVIFVEAIIPDRTRHRYAREKGELIASLVPKDQTLFIGKLKDEGLMFYYGREVRKFLPGEKQNVYALLIEAEWKEKEKFGKLQVIQWLRDQQDDPIVLVRIGSEE
jgi:4-amino-4-deoxy-L-arabinose transferase-like glycosyltransferase